MPRSQLAPSPPLLKFYAKGVMAQPDRNHIEHRALDRRYADGQGVDAEVKRDARIGSCDDDLGDRLNHLHQTIHGAVKNAGTVLHQNVSPRDAYSMTDDIYDREKQRIPQCTIEDDIYTNLTR